MNTRPIGTPRGDAVLQISTKILCSLVARDGLLMATKTHIEQCVSFAEQLLDIVYRDPKDKP